MPRWTPELNEILLALVYDCAMPLFNKEMQVKIIDELSARGHQATWDQVRYVCFFLVVYPALYAL